jgi:hypothetical protein
MKAADNLVGLHRFEENLRVNSLAAIDADPAMSDHWNFIAEAMNAIHAFTHDHVHRSEDELTLQYLGIRLFNTAGASIKLALSGYYQKAFHQVRDVLETSFLVDYLSTYPEKIDKWRRADKKARIVHFGPGVIRSALDRRDGYTSGGRTRIYGLISELASHPTYSGISPTTSGPEDMAHIGPFFDQKKLAVWLQEMALRLSPAALALMPAAENSDLELLATRMHYLRVLNAWWVKYRGLDIGRAIPRTP